MHQCLIDICRRFENIQDFLKQPSKEKESLLDTLFYDFIECFSNLKEEKLKYPKEFINDVKLYNEGFQPIIDKFEDKEIRYLMLSDFYDFARITKIYQKKI